MIFFCDASLSDTSLQRKARLVTHGWFELHFSLAQNLNYEAGLDRVTGFCDAARIGTQGSFEHGSNRDAWVVTHGLCRDRLSDRQDLVSWCMLHSQQPSTRLCNRSDRCPYLAAWVSRVMLVSVRVRDPSRSLHRRGRSPHRYSTSGLPGNDR